MSKPEPKPGDFIIVEGITIFVESIDKDLNELVTSDKHGEQFYVPPEAIDAICP